VTPDALDRARQEARESVSERSPLARLASLEIEVAGVWQRASKLGYALYDERVAVVGDGSIRSEAGNGFEANTYPAGGERFRRHVEAVCNALKQSKAWTNSSCGVHVHVDATDLGYRDLARLMCIYSRVERAMFAVVDSARVESNYCRPVRERFTRALALQLPLKHRVDEGVYGLSADILSPTIGRLSTEFSTPSEALAEAARVQLRSVKRNKYGRVHEDGGRPPMTDDAARYSALNLHSWFYRGSVEFRHHHGCLDATVLVPWAMLCVSMVQRAADCTLAEARRWPGGLDGLLALAPTDEVRGWVQRTHRKED